MVGSQNAATGTAYAGFTLWRSDSFSLYPAYLNARLSSPLISGTKYYISFKVSNGFTSPTSTYYANCGLDSIGILFTNVYYGNTIIQPPTPIHTRYAHIYTIQVILDTLNWTIISGNFTFDSAYNYIVIGGFLGNSKGTVTCLDPRFLNTATYYIDIHCRKI